MFPKINLICSLDEYNPYLASLEWIKAFPEQFFRPCRIYDLSQDTTKRGGIKNQSHIKRHSNYNERRRSSMGYTKSISSSLLIIMQTFAPTYNFEDIFKVLSVPFLFDIKDTTLSTVLFVTSKNESSVKELHAATGSSVVHHLLIVRIFCDRSLCLLIFLYYYILYIYIAYSKAPLCFI